ncbi:MAG: non-heme iron oxygenase ferredoxin subunit [Bdellovibrionales bacterium]|nr:non-heme iron oxygenase ferredoxin subunit [Bdellovibrionales bacterium]
MEYKVARVDQVEPGSCLAVNAGDFELVLFCHADGSYSALEDCCSHADVQLSLGTFENGEIECVAHGARFDARTGKALCMPAVKAVASYQVKIVDQDIFIVLPN